jgi:hypothetical protein
VADEEKIDKLAELQWLFFNEMTSCEVCLSVNQELVAQGHFADTKRRLRAAEIGLDVVDWLRKYKRQRLIDGEPSGMD